MNKNLFTILLAGLALALPTAVFAQVAPPLGAASSFVLFTAVGAFDNVGPTFVSGNIGTNAGAFSGFPLGVQLMGTINVANTLSTQAATDVQTAYGLMSAIPCVVPLAVLGGPPATPQVLLPNEYCVSQATTLAGNLILDAQGDPNATFFIRVGGALTTGEGSTVTLINGASASRVFWQVEGRVDMGRISVFQGTLIADGAINMIEGASLTGRGLSRGGAITLDTNTASLAVVTDVVWNGSQSTDWFTADNWTPATVPTSTINAYVLAGAPRYPLLVGGTAFGQRLIIGDSASVTQNAGNLVINQAWTNNGTFTATGGLVALGSESNVAPAVVLGGSSLNRFWNLTVAPTGAQQTALAAGLAVQRLLTLNGDLTTNNRPATLLSDTSGTAMITNAGGVVVGAATVQRYISPSLNAGLGYRQLSSPVSGMTVAGLATNGFSPVVNPAYNTSPTPGTVTPYPTVYSYEQSRLATATNDQPVFDKGWQSPATLGEALTVGRGYTVQLPASVTINFAGVPTTGPVNRSLSRNAANSTNGTDAGWQLVGNPYPAPLAYNRVAAADRQNLDAALYTFESTGPYTGQYRTYINGVGSGDSIVAVGQGFFVRVSAGQTSGTLNFRDAQRRTQYTDRSLRRSTAPARPLVQLDLQGAGLADPLYVYFEQGATAGTDADFDAVKLPNTHGLNLSAAGTDNLAISALPLMGATALTVPLQLRVPATGSYTLHAAQLLNLSNTHAYLRDRQTGTLTDLSTTPSYTFQLNAASTGPRFELVFTSQTALAAAPASLSAQVAVFPNPASRQVFVELPTALSRAATTATLLDALGRPVRSFVLPAGAAAHALPLAGVTAGLYSLRVTTDLGTVTKKLLVN
ncbi:ice-binding family protein [Hymenobacter sp. ASUV-10]|uniref:Ice-binding family protein n=1 Tax=Hymenobacter aranciens TaxID=3063996 RepID=A0ABT9BAI6_9BACT|nr:ice-binding family protein [Hymenobacter sp. ASUV-10]MDO7875281.1 ice-binding family protein [Hymenobacter sp. ASUV-10]